MHAILVLATLVKCLLIPTYHSTDFEVHRNWMAITHSLPFSQWYKNATSEWTLDYPPFFAWFEKALSSMAALMDPDMLRIQRDPLFNETVLFYQRGTVIVSELVLYWGLCRYLKVDRTTANALMVASVFLHPGLWIVDHIHFQYNGLLYGILVHSLVEARKQRYLTCAALFATLLNFKHIYLYIAPAYFVYLLGAYCFIDGTSKFSVARFSATGAVVIAVFALSLAPIIYTGQVPDLVSRLFPFTRGLCHAYWAPNIWALYAGLDRVLIIGAKKLGWAYDVAAVASMTRGYVGDTVFAVLPTVEAFHTLIITVLVQMLVLQVMWRKPTFDNFISSLTLCGFASYMFGWHVHEKAIMIVLVPYSFMAAKSKFHLRVFTILSSAGIVSLFPLLFQIQETPIKVLLTSMWYMTLFPGLCYCLQTKLRELLSLMECLYIMGLLLVGIFVTSGHHLIFGDQYEFLPLMLTSVYCAVGVVYGWVMLMYAHLAQL
ncbi:glycosyltransferase family 57 protein [Hesseltinella vesiculosa]|uniref:Alpha-1,3-glucosyltransferase n=1 Tax=Hesseltinella vesiculosa TaxID=101127 RepID=A0A1X2GFW7_9FUNG|nr:glycosyltransferase family 57 protein [Hesseltinella vesiculosa]